LFRISAARACSTFYLIHQHVKAGKENPRRHKMTMEAAHLKLQEGDGEIPSAITFDFDMALPEG
jgi:hypothetical protein